MSEMSLEKAVMSRHSVRGFLQKKVSQELLNKVFDIARWSPSGTNMQPWQVCVASGATRDFLRGKMMKERTRYGTMESPRMRPTTTGLLQRVVRSRARRAGTTAAASR